MYGLPKSVCVVPVIPMSAPSICFVCRKLSPHLGV